MKSEISVSALFLALAMTACGGASSEPEAAEPDVAAAVEAAETETAEHDGEDHAEGEMHGDEGHDEHAEEDHSEDHEGHEEHSGDDHDEDHHDHAGGTAHVHGGGDISFVLEGNTLTVDLLAPLANFGLSEAGDVTVAAFEAALDAQAPFVFPNSEAKCADPAERVVDIDNEGDHSEGSVTWTFNCDDPGALRSVQTELIDAFEGFEELDAVGLKDGADKAMTLTKSGQAFEFD